MILNRRTLIALAPLAVLAACSSGEPGSKPTSSITLPSASHNASLKPTHLIAKKAGIDHDVVTAGLAKDGTLNPPAKTIQHYDATVEPGAVGSSVIVAHVTYDGKDDLFVHLDRLAKGDVVTVKRADGSSDDFIVTKTETRIDKDALQHRQDVWGKASKPVLVLVTCDAKSPVEGVHHTDNVVVWAEPKKK